MEPLFAIINIEHTVVSFVRENMHKNNRTYSMVDLTTGIVIKNGKKFKAIKLKNGKTRLMQLVRFPGGREFTLFAVFEWDPDMSTAITKANELMKLLREQGLLARRYPVYGLEGVYISKVQNA